MAPAQPTCLILHGTVNALGTRGTCFSAAADRDHRTAQAAVELAAGSDYCQVLLHTRRVLLPLAAPHNKQMPSKIGAAAALVCFSSAYRRSDLAARQADRKHTATIMVMMHAPCYSTCAALHRCCTHCGTAVLEVLL